MYISDILPRISLYILASFGLVFCNASWDSTHSPRNILYPSWRRTPLNLHAHEEYMSMFYTRISECEIFFLGIDYGVIFTMDIFGYECLKKTHTLYQVATLLQQFGLFQKLNCKFQNALVFQHQSTSFALFLNSFRNSIWLRHKICLATKMTLTLGWAFCKHKIRRSTYRISRGFFLLKVGYKFYCTFVSVFFLNTSARLPLI